MKYFLLSLVTLVASLSVNAAESYEFSSFIDSSNYNGIYPRHDYIRYRGQEAELYPLSSALKAFWGDELQNIESPIFTGIKLALQGKFFGNQDTKVKSLRRDLCKDWSVKDVPFDYHSVVCKQFLTKSIAKGVTIDDEIKSILAAAPDGRLSEKDAVEAARGMMETYFHYLYDSKIEKWFLNYQTQFHYPSEIIFSTIYPKNSYIYGDAVTLIKNSKRTIDLNYYNVLAGNEWAVWGDAGEFIEPGYIDAASLVGYEIHRRGDYPDRLRNRVPIKLYSSQEREPIEFGFYPLKIKETTYIGIFDSTKKDGTKSFCMKPEGNEVYHCENAQPNFAFNGRMVLRGDAAVGASTNEEARLIAVLELCPVDETCLSGKKLLRNYKRSKRSLDVSFTNKGIGAKNVLKEIKKLQMKEAGKKLKVIIHQ